MLKHTATVPAHKHKQLLQETLELEEELFMGKGRRVYCFPVDDVDYQYDIVSTKELK